MNLQKELNSMIEAAKVGGVVVNNLFNTELDIIQKNSVADVVTQADIQSEKKILNILQRDFPKYNIYSEESGKDDNKSDRTFIIDPLDGTSNFVLGIPNFTVSIALFEKGRAIAGVVYVPVTRQIFTAIEGGGAYCDDKKVFVSNENNLEAITIAYTRGYLSNKERAISIMNQLNKMNIKRVLKNWSPAFDFCLLAKGSIENVINDGTEIYDYAAGKIIAREAGAQIVGFNNKEENNDYNDTFIVSNSQQNKQIILNMLNKLSY